MKSKSNNRQNDPAQGQERLPKESILPLLRKILDEFAIRNQRWRLPPNVYVTLSQLYLHPDDAEPAALADATHYPRQTMTHVLDVMEKKGLANRRPHPHDRRKKVVVLTARGRKQAETIFQDNIAFESAALQMIDGVDKAALKRFLSNYAEALAVQNRQQGQR